MEVDILTVMTEQKYIYSDKSGYYKDAEGSDGYIYSDGSGYFNGSDGSRGNKYSDGSGYFEDSNGNYNSYNSGEVYQSNTTEDFREEIAESINLLAEAYSLRERI